jgi:membrane associated rhomboid family serine protease
MFVVTLAGLSIGGQGEGVVTVALGEPLFDPWWEPITATYGHVDWDHFLSNAVVIAIFGTLVAYTTTTLRFHGFFLITGVLSSMAQVFISNSTGDIPTIVLGSSGAGFALIGYVVALLISGALSWTESKRLVLIVVGGGAALLTVFFSPPGSAIISHFVGALLGLLAGWLHILGWSLR